MNTVANSAIYFDPIRYRATVGSAIPTPRPQGLAKQLEELVAARTSALEKTVAELRARQKQLETIANHDALTGLANRSLLEDRFQGATERAKRSGEHFALLMIDLDGFKAVNDTYGHAAGDAVLVTVAQRLVAALRNCDSAARLGGDEFIVIVESLSAPLVASQVIRNLAEVLAGSMQLPTGEVVTIGASIGAAIYPEDGSDLVQMMSVADQAMYQRKATSQFGCIAA